MVTYISDSPCKKAGHLERYINNSECVVCKKEKAKQFCKLNRDPVTGQSLKWKVVKDMLTNYGIGPEEYSLLLIKQNGVCAICHRPEKRVDHRTKCITRLAVDHDHISGKVRGLLCAGCNMSLGVYESLKERCEIYLGGN